MIHRLVRRVRSLLSRAPRLRKTPRRIAASEHGIDRATVSRSALRTCEVLQAGGHRAYLVGGEVLDYTDGVRDIRRRRLRIIGDPETRYREDPVRMLRAVRFAAKLGFEIDPATRAPIARLAKLIENVPAARLFDEMLKLLMSG